MLTIKAMKEKISEMDNSESQVKVFISYRSECISIGLWLDSNLIKVYRPGRASRNLRRLEYLGFSGLQQFLPPCLPTGLYPPLPSGRPLCAQPPLPLPDRTE